MEVAVDGRVGLVSAFQIPHGGIETNPGLLVRGGPQDYFGGRTEAPEQELKKARAWIGK